MLGTTIGDREYLKTHPWITFTLDLRLVPYQLWMLLGEARSKCEHIAGVPLRPPLNDHLHLLYLAKGARATTAIEGNTLSEEEVRRVIKGELKLPPSKQYLATEVDNIVVACNQMLDTLSGGDALELTPDRIRALNGQVLKDLELGEGVLPGVFRHRSAVVGGYAGAPARDCEFLIKRLCDWLNEPSFLGMDSGLEAAILKAVIAHLYLALIHPFGDGNGRTARLVEYEILITSGVPSPAAHLLSNHFNETRGDYYRALDRASKVQTGPQEFVLYAVQGFVDGLKEQLDTIRYQQLQIAWENYVHQRFRDKNSAAAARKRRLVLDLSVSNEPVPRSRIRRLTPRLAEQYAGKTEKALSRDLNELVRMKLIERTPQGFRASKWTILSFLPLTMDPEQLEPGSQLALPFEETS